MVRGSNRAGYLIDTHILIWALENSPRLPPAYREVFESGPPLHVSSVVLWEIAAKVAKGKLEFDGDVDRLLAEAGCVEVPVRWSHARRLRTLPLLHRDPFDRMLVAQALVEGLTLLSVDEDIRRYPVDVL